MASILDRIENTLKNLCGKEENMTGVYYGACNANELEHWNYFVFSRVRTKRKEVAKLDFLTHYQVHVIHEDYIPEGYIEKVVKALEDSAEPGTKLRVTNEDIPYNYTFKGDSGIVVEIATINFYHPEKRK